MIFKDRIEAGEILAEKLKEYTNQPGVIVLGIPRGGVVVADVVAKDLNLPLDVVITRKIPSPYNPELALGAVAPDGEVVWEEGLIRGLEIRIEDLKEEVNREIQEIKRREGEYRKNKLPLSVKGKVVLLVDDGVATGATVLAAVRHLKRLGAMKVVAAAPVSSQEAYRELVREADQVIVGFLPEMFYAIGEFYENFSQVGDEEVIKKLEK